TLTTDCFSDQLLIFQWSVQIGSIQKITAQLERTMNGSDGLLFICRAIHMSFFKACHAHTAQAYSWYNQTLAAQCNLFYFHIPKISVAKRTPVCKSLKLVCKPRII